MLKIKSFSIEKLNDLYNYKNALIESSDNDLLILYGDNGSGKTTILNLIFHLLSAKNGQGHITYISKVPFLSISVTLSDGSIISAERKGSVTSFPVTFSLKHSNGKKFDYKFVPDHLKERSYFEEIQKQLEGNKSRSTRQTKSLIPLPSFYISNSDSISHTNYIEALASLEITCYFMATDRRMRSDLIEEKKPTARQIAEFESSGDDVIFRVRTQYLKEALTSATRYINRQVIRASNTGSKNTNDIYAELIRRIARDNIHTENVSIENALINLRDLGMQNLKFSELGLSPSLDFSEIIETINLASKTNKTVLNKILLPYIDSLNARFSALNPVGAVIQTFLSLLNGLFKHKSVTFSPTDGFLIFGPNGGTPLEMDQLSSGEQQLLLMFCYLLISNENQSIFMIDEPEISLNVKWQRELIEAMRKITKGSNTQLVIATHSIELLSQYSEMVISLDPEISN